MRTQQRMCLYSVASVGSRVLIGVLALCSFASILPSYAADHIDAPLVMEDARKDITDLFVFRNPADPSRIVLVMNLFTPVGMPESAQLFDSEARGEYAFFIDTDGDRVEEHTLRVTFDDQAGGEQRYTVRGLPGEGSLSGKVSALGEAPNIESVGEVKSFAGLRDDPFFFDFEGFNSFLAEPCIPTAGLRCPGNGVPSDFFLGLNVSSIVIEFPLTSLTGVESAESGILMVWAKTFAK